MPDTPQRIATDTSQKLAIRFGETIKAYRDSDTLDVNELKLIPLVQAGWLRYLTGINDQGEKFEPSSDPLLEELMPIMNYQLGDTVDKKDIMSILKNERIFGVDLEEQGLADKVTAYLNEMLKDKGAIRRTLKKYV